MNNRLMYRVALMAALAIGTGRSQSVLLNGDSAFARLDYVTATTQYDSLLRSGKTVAGLYWRCARLHVAVGDVTEGEERLDHYRKAVEYARESVATDSTCSDSYAWLAASLGSVAMDAGSKRKVELANEIKRALDRAVTLNPKNDVAWSILGTFYRSLGGVSWIERQLANLLLGSLPEGGYPESENAFNRAIGIAPQTVRHRFERALLYEETDRPAEASADYLACLQLPPQMKSDHRRKREAREWLDQNPAQVGSLR
jgi:tetratricopeptide (TPR) repeat protein